MRNTLLVLAGCALVGCHPKEPGGSDPTTADPTGDPTAAGAYAAGLEIGKVSLYQGVESVLVAGGRAPESIEAPAVIGRDALVRVFVRPGDDFEPHDITATLILSSEGAEDLSFDLTQRISSTSVDGELGSTFNFEIDGDMIQQGTELSVSLRDEVGGGDAASASWSSADTGGIKTRRTDELTIVLVPVVYNGDGSGRLPDTSQAVLDEIRDEMYGLYAASEVHVRVGDPFPWDREVSSFNPTSWNSLIDAIATLRGNADELPNTYYFGLFLPSDDFYDYCDQGCILGLSRFGVNTTNPALRSSIGVGFPEVAAETIAHEVGHAHGRFHSPCGGAAGPDRDYPYDEALIGSWGYDLVSGELKDPAVYRDIMGYCEPYWISDYTYFALMQRIAELGAQDPSARAAMRPVSRLSIDGAGHTERVPGTVPVGDPAAGGTEVRVSLFDASGAPRGRIPGWLFPNSHLPGGMVMLDRVLPDDVTAIVEE